MWFLVMGSAPSIQLCPYLEFSCLPLRGGDWGQEEGERDGLVVGGRERETQTDRRDNTEYTGHV